MSGAVANNLLEYVQGQDEFLIELLEKLVTLTI